MLKYDNETIITTKDLAELFGLTTARISQLGKSGDLVQVGGKGQYNLGEAVKAYITNLRNPKINAHGRANGNEGEENITDMKEKKLELECERLRVLIDKEIGSLVPIEEMIEGASMAGVAQKAEWESLEDELPPQLEGLTALQMKAKLRDYGRMKCIELGGHYEIEQQITEESNDKAKQMGDEIQRKSKAKRKSKTE